MKKYNIIPRYEEDCIHLHACRRFSKIVKNSGKQIPRGCNAETCTAYQKKERLFTREEVQHAINRAAEDGARGYSGYGDNIVEDYLDTRI